MSVEIAMKGWVVPPQRRLISIADAAQAPSCRTATQSTAHRPITPSRARRRPTLSASAAIWDAYSGSAGKRCVAEAAHSPVELDDRRRAPELAERAQDVALAADVEAAGVRHALLGEDAAAARLRAEPFERRVGPVERDPEPDGELDLVRRGGEREQERELGLRDERADPLDRIRPGEQLPRQRQVAAVDERDDREAAACLGRAQLRHEPEVVVEEPGQDRLGGDVDDPRPARAQQAQHEAEEPLFVRREDGDQMVGDLHADRVDAGDEAAERHKRLARELGDAIAGPEDREHFDKDDATL